MIVIRMHVCISFALVLVGARSCRAVLNTSPNYLLRIQDALAKHFFFKNIIVIGDSFSDNGSSFGYCIFVYFVTTNQLSNTYRFTWPADPAYFEGRFSNGPAWVENLASTLSLELRDFAISGCELMIAPMR
jgi:hypothetical protein